MSLFYFNFLIFANFIFKLVIMSALLGRSLEIKINLIQLRSLLELSRTFTNICLLLLTDFVTNNRHQNRCNQSLRAPTSQRCHQHPKMVNNVKSPTSLSPYLVTETSERCNLQKNERSTLICVNPRPSVTVLCVSTLYQRIHSNMVKPKTKYNSKVCQPMTK